MSRRNRHPGDWSTRLTVLVLALLGLTAILLLIAGLVLAGSTRGY
jgi:hypothetical protein